MPINFIDYTESEVGQQGKSLGSICKGEWELPAQIEALEAWLNSEGCKLAKGTYVADLGFLPRSNALGGGAVVSPESMQIMCSVGMSLFLSEYPGGHVQEET